ncbi:hypothetical protein D3227_35100 [Mesorhizobium waimense]|uniref:Uncharacterized protein n=2 Tax=Mesorhizobium waimense TaxID=1300307 RepID=A0A3A5K154_9HYPH|nr:hypothetical protein D3227_35100 [Mesorhizobium waimense]
MVRANNERDFGPGSMINRAYHGTDGAAVWKSAPDGEIVETEPANRRRWIEGIASTRRPSISGRGNKMILSPMAASVRLPLSLKSGHDRGEVGRVHYLRRTADQIIALAAVYDTPAGDHLWSLIRSGEVRSFSVLASDQVDDAVVDGFLHLKSWRIGEISCVREPANIDCQFSIILDDGQPVHVEPMPPRVPYAGAWKSDQWFKTGSFATHRGSLWHANVDTKGIVPGGADGNRCWQLAVKNGHAHKLEDKQEAEQ